jgi:hypothetical protein
MRTIYKYPLVDSSSSRTLPLPRGARPLSAGYQSDEDESDDTTLYLWALVDSEAETVGRTIHILGTGEDASHILEPGVEFVQTVGPPLWRTLHVFIGPEPAAGG